MLVKGWDLYLLCIESSLDSPDTNRCWEELNILLSKGKKPPATSSCCWPGAGPALMAGEFSCRTWRISQHTDMWQGHSVMVIKQDDFIIRSEHRGKAEHGSPQKWLHLPLSAHRDACRSLTDYSSGPALGKHRKDTWPQNSWLMTTSTRAKLRLLEPSPRSLNKPKLCNEHPKLPLTETPVTLRGMMNSGLLDLVCVPGGRCLEASVSCLVVNKTS